MINSFPNLVLTILILLSFISSSSSSLSFTGQLIEQVVDENEIVLQCSSWRVAAEANNLNPWKRVPEDCAEYLITYVMGKGYEYDLQRVSKEAAIFAASFDVGIDGNDAWIFDVDETLLSNLPFYSTHGYGSQVFDHVQFDEWVEVGMAPTIESSLELYHLVLKMGFKIILLTGRSERHRNITIDNLVRAGFRDWDHLILRGLEDHHKTAITYKSEKRDELIAQGYRIVGNYGDQWSDLLGSSMSIRSFKLSNPMYYIS